MKAPDIIHTLVTKYEQHRYEYLSGKYNETELRREFLDPFFEALGWDVTNKRSYAERFKEVIHEASLAINGQTKAADYAFRIGGDNIFFVEAKKPSINIDNNSEAAFQLRRYGWSAKLPLSILTNFEKLAVYDCRIRPNITDKASDRRIRQFGYLDYLTKWEDIFSIFSREAVIQGAFDRFAENRKGKKGTAEVDNVFLEEIEHWREILAKNIAKNNSNLNTRELNYSVQMTIDRIIFLRICEDRGIEIDEQMLRISNNKNIYQNLLILFKNADTRYNSGLFHFSEDELTPQLKIDDKTLKEILKHLYYPDSPYAFNYIPADILGQVYERFLGKVIRLTPGHQARIEEKPEVRKAGGVYYTPKYIVEYIVNCTLGKLLIDKNPKQVSKLKILDPACGSGSFLLVAYEKLLDWYTRWYVNNEPDKWARGATPKIYQTGKNDWRLTTAEKKFILLNQIFGVDIDVQAVEVTKLSLLLKVLEGESQEIFGKQTLFKERALPDLDANIQCGNSLITSKYYQHNPTPILGDDELYRVNAFDWHVAFKDIFNMGGFDVVIGNPPYIFTREQLTTSDRLYFSAYYKLSWEKQNTYLLFMELLLKLINKNGRGGYIVPNSWLTIESGKLIRPIIIPHLDLIVDLNYSVFEKVSMEPSIFVVVGSDGTDPLPVIRVNNKTELNNDNYHTIEKSSLNDANTRIVFSNKGTSTSIIDKLLNNSITIGDVFDVRTGLQAYEKGKGTPIQSAEDVSGHVFDRDKNVDKNSIKYLQGSDVSRYAIGWSGKWMQYGPWLSQPRTIDIFCRPRILVREITSKFPNCVEAAYIDAKMLNNKSVLNILHENDDEATLKILLGVLNSRIMSIYYKSKAVKSARKIFPKIVIRNLREFPYPKNIATQDRNKLIEFVDLMLNYKIKLINQRTPQEKEMLERQIIINNDNIDKLVNKLFGLTNAEVEQIEIV